MKVFVDADACPVVDIVLRLCREFSVECTLLCDTAHEFQREDAAILVVDKGTDSVDFALVNRIAPGDVVITQDYGLASMCLAKRARILHQDGWEYTADNIEGLLFLRHASRKHRAAGGRSRGPSKRKKSQNDAFAQSFRSLLQNRSQG